MNVKKSTSEKVDSGILQLLQGTIPDIVDRQLDAQMTLQAIAKIIEDYEIRQLEGLPGKSGNK
ncbi:hypothetical protein MAR_005413 [Mya arenaria]|uniref:Uncharacterized protein n=1 Tax=Mya arenaria TaxID=6604 RepID=A0ABY7F3L8_MYAAR|nr:hypothetical protein MAR_005413 [Mya arenaria]